MANIENPKALVLVLDDITTVERVVNKLIETGTPRERIEVVTRNVDRQAPEVQTPKVHDTTASTMVDSGVRWAGIGAGTGLLVGMFTAFPGLALGMAVIGGLTAGVMGGIAGVDRAIEDESVDLPELAEYQELVEEGNFLVVVLGAHEDLVAAKDVVNGMISVRSHMHPIHGHRFHEHPAFRD